MTLAAKHVTVPRTVLRDAIERGILSVSGHLGGCEEAALRGVGETATVIAVGTYRSQTGVRCPVSLAFPDS